VTESRPVTRSARDTLHHHLWLELSNVEAIFVVHGRALTWFRCRLDICVALLYCLPLQLRNEIVTGIMMSSAHYHISLGGAA
jgi:hypothetical protein